MKFRYTCIVDTPYALALYCLRMDDAAVAQTRFFVGRILPKVIIDRLPCVVSLPSDSVRWRSRLYRACFRLKCLVLHWRYVAGTQIFAQDHILCAAPLICRKSYTLIEDGPDVYSRNPPIPFVESCFVRLGLWALNGSIYLKHFGRNQQCVNRWVTSMDDVRMYQDEKKSFERLDIPSLWKGACEGKKRSVLHLFSGEKNGLDVMELVRKCRTILLTQPFMEDCDLSEKEMGDVYRSAIELYKHTGVAIKPHPRDKFDYEREFPDCKVLRTYMPMQLLCALGIRFDSVITTFSTAISDFPKDTEVVWVETTVNEKLYKRFGPMTPPAKFSNVLRLWN